MTSKKPVSNDKRAKQVSGNGAITRPKKGLAKTHSVEEPVGQYAVDVSMASMNFGASISDNTLVLSVTGVRSGSHSLMLEKIKKGLPVRVLSQLEAALNVSQKHIGDLLSIPPSTLTRRKKQGYLQPDESDRVVRYARLKDAALSLMEGNDEAATAWLSAPLEILDGESPLEHSVRELGARDVETLIGRLRHGVFS